MIFREFAYQLKCSTAVLIKLLLVPMKLGEKECKLVDVYLELCRLQQDLQWEMQGQAQGADDASLVFQQYRDTLHHFFKLVQAANEIKIFSQVEEEPIAPPKSLVFGISFCANLRKLSYINKTSIDKFSEEPVSSPSRQQEKPPTNCQGDYL